MKFLLEEPACRLYNSNDQEQIDVLRRSQLADNKGEERRFASLRSVYLLCSEPSLSIGTLHSVLVNRFFPSKESDNLLSSYINSSLNEKQFNQLCSSLTKRIQACSLSHHTTMAITATASFSEEQTNSVEYENTYLSSEDTSRSDDVSSLTTITSNLPKQVSSLEPCTSVYADTTILNSDIDEISEEITSNERLYDYVEMNLNLQ